MIGLALLLLGAGGQAPEILVDRVIAVVDKEVVTESELLTEARVALVFREGERGAKLAATEKLDAELLASMQEWVINQILVANQVRRIGYVEVSEQEVDKAVRRFAQAFVSPDAYRAFARKFDLADSTLRDILRRDLRNEKFLAQRLRPYVPGGGEEEDPGGRYNDALARWLSEVRANAEIRLLGPTGELELQ